MAYAKTTSMEQRRAWIAQWESSGLPIGEFCSEHGIKEPTFLNWRRQRLAEAKPGSAVELVEVARTGPVDGTALEIVLPNGITLRVPAGFERRWLEEVLAAVRPC